MRQTGELETYLVARFAQGDVFSEVVPSIPEAPSASGANAIASFKRQVGSASLHGNAKFVCGDGRIVGLVMSAE